MEPLSVGSVNVIVFVIGVMIFVVSMVIFVIGVMIFAVDAMSSGGLSFVCAG